MPSLEFPDVVMRLVKSYQNHHLYTAMPGTVVGVAEFGGQQVIDVDPAINDIYEDGEIIELPVVQEVPVVLPSAGEGILSFPIKKGDPVLLLFSQRSVQEWLDRREFGKYTPSDNRNFHLTDAIAVPGLYSKVNNLSPNTTDVELKFKKDYKITLQPDGKIIITNGKSTITLNNDGQTVISNSTGSLSLETNGEVLHHTGAKIDTNGDFITASGISLDNHVHTGSPTAPSGPVSDTGAAK